MADIVFLSKIAVHQSLQDAQSWDSKYTNYTAQKLGEMI
jgi:hypothetical protein